MDAVRRSSLFGQGDSWPGLISQEHVYGLASSLPVQTLEEGCRLTWPAVDLGRPHLAISLRSPWGCLTSPFPLAFLQYFPGPPNSAVSPLLHSPPVAPLDCLEMLGPGLNWSCRLATGHGGRNAGFPRLARFPPNPVDPSGRHCRIVQWNSIQILSPTAPFLAASRHRH